MSLGWRLRKPFSFLNFSCTRAYPKYIFFNPGWYRLVSWWNPGRILAESWESWTPTFDNPAVRQSSGNLLDTRLVSANRCKKPLTKEMCNAHTVILAKLWFCAYSLYDRPDIVGWPEVLPEVLPLWVSRNSPCGCPEIVSRDCGGPKILQRFPVTDFCLYVYCCKCEYLCDWQFWGYCLSLP